MASLKTMLPGCSCEEDPRFYPHNFNWMASHEKSAPFPSPNIVQEGPSPGGVISGKGAIKNRYMKYLELYTTVPHLWFKPMKENSHMALRVLGFRSWIGSCSSKPTALPDQIDLRRNLRASRIHFRGSDGSCYIGYMLIQLKVVLGG